MSQLKLIRNLIADDSYAMTFQDMGQYRTALLKMADQIAIPTGDGWHPIESAPKDGRTIWVGYMEGGKVTQYAEMHWSDEQRNGLFPGAVGMWVCPGGNFTWNAEPAEFGPSHWKHVRAEGAAS
jgi:hypothetical protein